MTNKYRKRCSTSFVIKESQMEETMRYHFLLLKFEKFSIRHNRRGSETHVSSVGGNINWHSFLRRYYVSCGSDGKESACNARDLGQEDPLEKGMATHSSILAWIIPWTLEPGGL